jgi:hypothetical protein
MIRRWPYRNKNPRFDVLRNRLHAFFANLEMRHAQESEDDLTRAEQQTVSSQLANRPISKETRTVCGSPVQRA